MCNSKLRSKMPMITKLIAMKVKSGEFHGDKNKVRNPNATQSLRNVEQSSPNIIKKVVNYKERQ